MDAGVQHQGAPARRPHRWRRAGLALLAILVVALAGLWLVRKPLATRYADRFLALKHVPARYRIADLGLGRQRLVDVVIGDPADPDLVADWLEARTAIGLSGPYLTGVRGGHVRVRARWVDGKLSLGSIDRLLPKGNGAEPFALPALALDIDDLRARVETPWGRVGAKLTGSGRLDGGFDGKLALTAARFGRGCAAENPRAALRVQTLGAGVMQPTPSVKLEVSAESAGLRCAGVASGYANLNGGGEIVLGGKPRWSGRADVAGTALHHPLGSARSLAGSINVRGEDRFTDGRVALGLTDWHADAAGGRSLALNSPFAITDSGVRLGDPQDNARVTGQGIQLAPRLTRRLAALSTTAPGTPLAPLLRATGEALRRAGTTFDATATGALVQDGGAGTIRLSAATLRAASGASARWSGMAVSRWGGEEGGGVAVDGTLASDGGGLPTLTARLTQRDPGNLAGVVQMLPYAAGGARLALTPVRFAYTPAGWRVATQATLSGPLAGGRVEALTLPIDARGRGSAATLGGGCVPVRWQRIAVSGLVLDPAAVRLCGEGGALVTVANGRLGGGATLGTTRLTGQLGSTPLVLAATGARMQLAGQRFALTGVAARLGRPDRLSTLTMASLDGAVTADGIGGSFAGAGGRIGAVPLVMSDAAGRWRYANGTLGVDTALTVSDAQTAQPRFRPLPVRAVTLTLRGNAVAASGQLRSPDAARLVTDVRLTHDLASGTGAARFTVPGLVFDKALQPDRLTPVTFGVVADVRGTVTGDGVIDWSPAGVTSTGRFTTEGTDLAAAFGPVQGIAGTITFTDLLALESAPGQRFTVREVNPGIAVTDGVVTFQTLANARVAVAGARWPFAGGTLTLAPTLLDFGDQAKRRLTFRVEGAAADQFLQQFDFENLDATGIFDGVLPMVFDEAGGRIEGGHLQVRPGGGTLAYVGTLTQKDVGFWGNLAFQALKSLRYRSLAIQMNGPLAGEMVTDVRFTGVSQGEGAARGGIVGLLVGRLQRLPFIFNIRIKAPFRGLLDATASFYDPRRLIQRNLPQLIEEQNRRARTPQGGNQAPPARPLPPSSTSTPAKAGAQLR